MNEQNAKCATLTPPALPALAPPTSPDGINSGFDRPAGFRNAREEPGRPDDSEDDRWLVGYRVNRMNNTVMLLGFNPAITETLRSKKWASLVRNEGWVLPLRYLAHVERLLFGADVDLFDVEGAPTPVQRERERDDDRAAAKQVLAEIHAARKHHEEHQAEAHAAFVATRRAFAEAVRAATPADESEAS